MSKAEIQQAELSRSRAEWLAKHIRDTTELALGYIEEFIRGRGWIALGYDTWKECAKAEFGQSARTLEVKLRCKRLSIEGPEKSRVGADSAPTQNKTERARANGNGQTTINGTIVEDPPEIAKARAAGKIPASANVEIIDPDTDDTTEEETGPVAEQLPPEVEVSDEEWFNHLPLASQLDGPCLLAFQEDALFYRHLTEHRKLFAHHAKILFNKLRRKSTYAWRTKFYLGIDGPDKWLLCPKLEDGGCGGTGQVKLIGQCPKCHGHGYWIK